MTSRERVVRALNFQSTDRIPKDLGGMRSTGISVFAYPKLCAALGLPARRPMVYDHGQMLALVEMDVLDALSCDVVTIEGGGLTNAFPQPEKWHQYDFGGRLPALVENPSQFAVKPDGTVTGPAGQMVPDSFVFDSEHAGQPLMLDGDWPKPNLAVIRKELKCRRLTDAQIKQIASLCRRVRGTTDKAIVLWGPLNLGLCIHGWGGLAVFPILCLEEPELIREMHELTLAVVLENVRALLPEIKDSVDILGTDSDDWGNQQSLMAPPCVFRDLFLPFRQQHNAEIHRLAPGIKTMLHSCGALYELLDLLTQSGTDILNPVQWPAGGHTPTEWKAKVAGKMTLWGGGVNSQATLPRGSVADIEREVRQTVAALKSGGGFVFNNIHNLLAEISPEKIIDMYRAAA